MALGTDVYDPSKIIGSQPQVDDSVANQVTKLAAKDSALNQMARNGRAEGGQPARPAQ